MEQYQVTRYGSNIKLETKALWVAGLCNEKNLFFQDFVFFFSRLKSLLIEQKKLWVKQKTFFSRVTSFLSTHAVAVNEFNKGFNVFWKVNKTLA